MHPNEHRQSAEILQFPTEARRTAVEMSRRFSKDRLPDFVGFAMGGASYHEDAIREEAERNRRGH
ncbi:DUF2735 domain-containing protein [Jiella avicenniae]|uniref:DUF2735 domain-containing protein n=1 Tax=Jiella avicenniae TaxID=2907202 RepID=A0A9X1NZL3_9HYPH|nr:DUF2735 domain-containing protein [Jiella avicenniae]MCE7028567.1 DUF2735 domain-containing protein [Jiella avicenniae]